MMHAEEVQLEISKSCNYYIFMRAESLMNTETLQFIRHRSIQLRRCGPVMVTGIVWWNRKRRVNTACLQDQDTKVQLPRGWALPEFVTYLILNYVFVLKIYTISMCDPMSGWNPQWKKLGIRQQRQRTQVFTFFFFLNNYFIYLHFEFCLPPRYPFHETLTHPSTPTSLL